MKTEKVLELMKLPPETTKADFSRFLNVSPQTLSNWFSRDNIPEKYAPLMAFFFSKKTNRNISEGYFLESKNEIIPLKAVPIIGNTSCGACQINSLQEDNMKTYIDENLWKDDLYAVIANGNSMAGEIYDGDKAIISPTETPVSGDMVYYKLDEESAIKILVIDEDAHMMQFVPINTNEHFKTRTIRLDDEETLSRLTTHKIIEINSSKRNNRAARLKMIGR